MLVNDEGHEDVVALKTLATLQSDIDRALTRSMESMGGKHGRNREVVESASKGEPETSEDEEAAARRRFADSVTASMAEMFKQLTEGSLEIINSAANSSDWGVRYSTENDNVNATTNNHDLKSNHSDSTSLQEKIRRNSIKSINRQQYHD